MYATSQSNLSKCSLFYVVSQTNHIKCVYVQVLLMFMAALAMQKQRVIGRTTLVLVGRNKAWAPNGRGKSYVLMVYLTHSIIW